MNILIAADYATPASGNFIASLVELGGVIKNNGSITLIFPENENTRRKNSWVDWLRREGHTVYLASPQLQDGEALRFLKEIVDRHDIDILHIHFGMYHRIAVDYSKELPCRVLIHDHMDFPANSNMVKQRVRCALKSLRYRRNGVSIASVNPSKDKAYCFAKHWYVPNGLSMVRNVEKSATRDEIRRELNLNPENLLCLFLGWDVYLKGLDIAVRAVAELRKSEPGVILGIVGMGDHPNEERLRYIKDATGIDSESPWIRYLPSREDMFAYHRGADVYLSASRSEAFSYGILEAISQNTPVVVSDISGTSWCHAYTKATLYPVEDYKICASAIQKASTLRWAPSNSSEIVHAYSIEKWCAQMIEIYESLL